MGAENIDHQLENVPLFAALDGTDRSAIWRIAEVVECSAGDVITREGSTTNDFFVMLSGEATVSVNTETGGEPVELNVVRPGETFGELSALLDIPRTSTVVAARRSRLLRLDRRALETLYATSPRFALAFSRELAQRLKQALMIKNDLQVENLPAKITLDAPDLTRMREYMITYYTTALRQVLKQHRLIVDRSFPACETTFVLSVDEYARWFELFDTPDERTPFTYHTMVGTMALMHVVADVGVNFKNLMHLKTEMSIAQHEMKVGHTYRLASQIDDIIALRDDRVALVCASRVYDQAGHLMRSCRDYFIILNLEAGYVDALKAAKHFGHTEITDLQGLASRKPELSTDKGFETELINVPETMGFSYGKVSGDLNLVHTTRLAARMFGHPRPFIQGLCTANYALRYLTRIYGPPAELSMTFTKRVFVGQQIELRHVPGKLEVCDRQGELLAFGQFLCLS